MGIADDGNAAAADTIEVSAEWRRISAVLKDVPDAESIRRHLGSFEDARCLIEAIDAAVQQESMMACLCPRPRPGEKACDCDILADEIEAATRFVKERRDALEKRRAEYLTSKGLRVEDFP